MPDTPSLTLIKRFMYRDALEEWSNTYHFNGTQPANTAAWKTLADAVWAAERLVYTLDHTLVAAYGYNAGNDHSVAQIDYLASPPTNPNGNYSVGTDLKWAGDQAGWIRAYVGQSSTGKKVYIRKYYHGGASAQADPDELATPLKAAYATLAAKLLDGTLPGSFVWASPQGTAGTIPTASRYVTTRTLKRRGRRP